MPPRYPGKVMNCSGCGQPIVPGESHACSAAIKRNDGSFARSPAYMQDEGSKMLSCVLPVRQISHMRCLSKLLVVPFLVPNKPFLGFKHPAVMRKRMIRP